MASKRELPVKRRASGPRIGMRLWLTGAFAAVSMITAAAVYFFGDNHQALIGAVLVGVLTGFLIAVAISHRVAGLALAAGEMAGGSFDAPLNVSGPDEIGDLARALDSMRASLKESFGVLTADRNKLAAIFDGLTDVVMVVDYEGPVRFSNRAATRLLDANGMPPESILPQLHRASEVGFSAHPALRIGDRAYAMTARSLPDERAVLAVLRDRTDELLLGLVGRGANLAFTPGTNGTGNPCTNTGTTTYGSLPEGVLGAIRVMPIYCIIGVDDVYSANGALNGSNVWTALLVSYRTGPLTPPTATPTATTVVGPPVNCPLAARADCRTAICSARYRYSPTSFTLARAIETFTTSYTAEMFTRTVTLSLVRIS